MGSKIFNTEFTIDVRAAAWLYVSLIPAFNILSLIYFIIEYDVTAYALVITAFLIMGRSSDADLKVSAK